jgi:membrane associated rhomboid family serine protease
MGCVDTERDWLGYKFVPLFIYSSGSDIVCRTWLISCVCVVYRTNTFPLVHAGFFHAFMNILALTPLLERFEAEYGTLTTLALFLGRTCTLITGGLLWWWQMADLMPSFIHDSGATLHVYREGGSPYEHDCLGS